MDALITDFDEAKASCATLFEDDRRYLCEYDERDWSLIQPHRITAKPKKKEQLKVNAIRSAIDGLVAMLSEHRPLVTFMTNDADWENRQAARRRTAFVQGILTKTPQYRLTPLWVKHACITGRGFIHVLRDNGRISLEVAPPWEVVVYQPEVLYGVQPRRMWRTRLMRPKLLADMFPEHSTAILRGEKDKPIEFVDGWDLDEQKHVQFVCLDGDKITVTDEDYKHPGFPIVGFFLDDAPVGWGGSGLVEVALPMQRELDLCFETIANNVYYGGTLRAAVERNANVRVSQLSNALGCPVIEYVGQPPVFAAADTGLAQLLGYMEYLERKIFDVTGINQGAAQSANLPASQSGRAALIQNQRYSRRFAAHQQRLEAAHVDLAWAILEAAEDLAEAGHNVVVTNIDSKGFEKIDYKSLGKVNRDELECTAWTVSFAGETTAARLAYIDQMLAMGMIDLRGANAIYRPPMDVQESVNTMMAPKDLVDAYISRIVEQGEPQQPHELMDIQYAVLQSALMYQRGELAGAPPERLRMLLEFHDAAMDLFRTAQQKEQERIAMMQAQAAAAGQGGAPPEGAVRPLMGAPT